MYADIYIYIYIYIYIANVPQFALYIHRVSCSNKFLVIDLRVFTG
jgi:hypothetical protein